MIEWRIRISAVRSSLLEVLYEMVFLEISIKKEALAEMLSCEFCGISNNTFCYRIPPVAASVSHVWSSTQLCEKCPVKFLKIYWENTCNRVKNLFAAGVFAVRYVKFLERFFYKTPEKDCFSAMRGNYFSGLKILGR